jgi:thiosulfate/3-mercaptopyruvate sulfurtransferase
MSRRSALVDTNWLQEHLGDPDVVIIEVDERPLLYRLGHIEGAHCVDWRNDLQDPVARDVPDRDAVRRLWRRIGLTTTSSVVFYGDKSNWYACFGYWLFRLYGLRNLHLLDGGRQAWVTERRAVTREPPAEALGDEPPQPRLDKGQRARWPDVASGLLDGTQVLDVRTPAEFRGDVLTEPGYPEEAARQAGHIPGALSVPWEFAVADDGRMRAIEDLRTELERRSVRLEDGLITYCRIGERSAHTWFVLHELLGIRARNYDGSWTEWGSMVGMPVALGDEPGTPRCVAGVV